MRLLLAIRLPCTGASLHSACAAYCEGGTYWCITVCVPGTALIRAIINVTMTFLIDLACCHVIWPHLSLCGLC